MPVPTKGIALFGCLRAPRTAQFFQRAGGFLGLPATHSRVHALRWYAAALRGGFHSQNCTTPLTSSLHVLLTLASTIQQHSGPHPKPLNQDLALANPASHTQMESPFSVPEVWVKVNPDPNPPTPSCPRQVNVPESAAHRGMSTAYLSKIKHCTAKKIRMRCPSPD